MCVYLKCTFFFVCFCEVLEDVYEGEGFENWVENGTGVHVHKGNVEMSDGGGRALSGHVVRTDERRRRKWKFVTLWRRKKKDAMLRNFETESGVCCLYNEEKLQRGKVM